MPPKKSLCNVCVYIPLRSSWTSAWNCSKPVVRPDCQQKKKNKKKNRSICGIMLPEPIPGSGWEFSAGKDASWIRRRIIDGLTVRVLIHVSEVWIGPYHVDTCFGVMGRNVTWVPVVAQKQNPERFLLFLEPEMISVAFWFSDILFSAHTSCRESFQTKPLQKCFQPHTNWWVKRTYARAKKEAYCLCDWMIKEKRRKTCVLIRVHLTRWETMHGNWLTPSSITSNKVMTIR